jgi:hypothetical protein
VNLAGEPDVGYRAADLHLKPVGRASFQEVRQVLLEVRDCTGHLGLNESSGWSELETYTDMVQLGQCDGVELQDGHVHAIELGNSKLTGMSLHQY